MGDNCEEFPPERQFFVGAVGLGWSWPRSWSYVLRLRSSPWGASWTSCWLRGALGEGADNQDDAQVELQAV